MNLNAATRNAYFEGYYPGEPLPNPVIERTNAILRAVGVTVLQ
jgi:hypothetical protein